MKAMLPGRFVLFWLLTAGGCAVDLATKTWIFGRLGMPSPLGDRTDWLWKPVFGFTTNLNEGALFGLGQGQVTLFAVLSVIALVGILYWLFVVGAAQDLLLTIALGMVCGGIFGNLYDRLGFPGLKWEFPQGRRGEAVYAVRDWLDFRLINWPIFNIADSLLVCGAGLLVWHAFRAERTAKLPAAVGDPSISEPAPPDPTAPRRAV